MYSDSGIPSQHPRSCKLHSYVATHRQLCPGAFFLVLDLRRDWTGWLPANDDVPECGGVRGFLLHRYFFGDDDLLGIASGPCHLLHANIRLCSGLRAHAWRSCTLRVCSVVPHRRVCHIHQRPLLRVSVCRGCSCVDGRTPASGPGDVSTGELPRDCSELCDRLCACCGVCVCGLHLVDEPADRAADAILSRCLLEHAGLCSLEPGRHHSQHFALRVTEAMVSIPEWLGDGHTLGVQRRRCWPRRRHSSPRAGKRPSCLRGHHQALRRQHRPPSTVATGGGGGSGRPAGEIRKDTVQNRQVPGQKTRPRRRWSEQHGRREQHCVFQHGHRR
mmetsp:Transcript_35273/g.82292  ORF Transcript_35273/g.82292 Transcript_35273/m.82292 type:complete len:331 (-) Transcript_35273:73-1065(-)